jgi:cobalt-zinc-cadmium efflux system membrane fusion protein
MRPLVCLALLPLLLSGCDRGGSEASAPTPAPISPKTVRAEAAREVGLTLLPAMVVQPPGARVAVAAPFAGMVQSVAVQPGQAVKKGQVLATMISRDALVLAGDMARAEARRGATRAEAARMEALAREGVVAGARADSAKAIDAEAAIDAREAERLLARAGADREGRVRLVAPISGRVAEMAIEVGAPLDGMTAPFVIESGDSRWLSVQVPERLAGQVRPGLAVRTTDGQRGRLMTVAGSIDPTTRAFAGRARLDEGGPARVAGTLVPLMLLGAAPEGAVRVPMAAVVQEGAAALVFVKEAADFVARPVRRVGTGDPAVIVSGLKRGEVVATSNLPELRAAAAR